MQNTAQIARRGCVFVAMFVTWAGLASASEPLVVAAVNYPLAYFAERIGGDAVVVRFLPPPGTDPAFWEPDTEQVQVYQAADLILLNGARYAKWSDKVTLPRRKIVDTSRSFRADYLPAGGATVHSHGPGGDHSHAGLAFTTWLDPRQAIAQARAVAGAMSRARSEHSEDFSLRAETLVTELGALDTGLAEAFAAMGDEPLLASHPVYQYLARRYALDVRALLWEPGTDPGNDGWQTLERLLDERPARWMLWEAEPRAGTREQLAAHGVGVIVFEPGGNRPSSGDYLTLMERNVSAVLEAATR